MMFQRHVLITLMLGGCALAWADPPDPGPAPQASPPATQTQPATPPADPGPAADVPDHADEADASPPRDPFSTTRRMQEQAQQQRPGLGQGGQPLRLPRITLRGYIEGAGETPTGEPNERNEQIALLEIEAVGVVLMRPGEQMSLPAADATLTLRVIEMTRRSVVVEIDPINKRMAIR